MFCDAAGVTKAHLFAESWTTLFDEPDGTREHGVVLHRVDPATDARDELKRGTTFSWKARRVCQECNGGWLRELEERVRPVMGLFASNTAVALTASEQSDHSLWATASVLMAMRQDQDAVEFADPRLVGLC